MENLIPGRIVHFVPYHNLNHRAAVIVDLCKQEGVVDLYIFPNWGGLEEGIRVAVSHDLEDRPGTWHWIERA